MEFMTEAQLGIERNVSLAGKTTFACGGNADFFARAETPEAVASLFGFARERGLPVTVLGGGSNVLISDDGVRGLVIGMAIRGCVFDGTRLTLGAGENWDDIVALTTGRGLYGIETLSYIPGSVGGAIVQNIGAYGSEISSVVESVDVYDTEKDARISLSAGDLEFAYRMSVFKKPIGRHLIVLGCTLRLADTAPAGRTFYPDVGAYFSKKYAGSIPDMISPTEIREAVIAIRTAKLPNWKVVGTAGSYFKNPIIPINTYLALKEQYPDLPHFAVGEKKEQVKVPLGCIIDRICGLKGYRAGPVGIYEKQALVLVNYGGASSREIRNLEATIAESVKHKTGITVEREVELMGFI